MTSRAWNLGEGVTRRHRSVERTWKSPGFYVVTLTVSDGENPSTMSRTLLVEPNEPAGSCEFDAETLCLRAARYQVTASWRGNEGSEGAGRVVHRGTNDSGMFSFFDGDNWEVLVKVLDGCEGNGSVWVLVASSTDLGLTIRVTDTVTDTVQEYTSEPGQPAPAIVDTEAFPNGCRSPNPP